MLKMAHLPGRPSRMTLIHRTLLLFLAACAAVPAQPKVSLIEVFGNRRVSSERILRALSLKPGAPLPRSKAEAEETLEALDGVARAALEAFCCEEGQPVLYIGVQERGQPGLDLRPEPAGAALLPPAIVQVYEDFTQALGRAAPEDLEEDFSAGHSLMRGVALRALQERFAALAELHAGELRETLAKSASEDHRAIAAYVLGYAPDKAAAADSLQQALRDPSQLVRSNAARALKAMAAKPDIRARIQPTWFVEMLNSPALTDRLEGARALLTLFETLSPQTQAHLRERALPALMEMARFRHLPHALPAFLILGKAAGLPDSEVQTAWSAGPADREKLLKQIASALRAK